MTAAGSWWVITLLASFGQTLRNAMQRDLIGALGAVGAAQVRFLFGFPFACVFLVVIAFATGEPFPRLDATSFGWAALGGVTQIVATALMLAAMRWRSFVVVVAATKTEPAQVAIFALVVFGERPSPLLLGAILLATSGVWLMSGVRAGGGWKPLAQGVVSASFFAVAAISYRQAVLSVPQASFVMAASFVLVVGLGIQTAILFAYLGLFDRRAVGKILASWRPSLFAGFMGALASQLWFVAFALSDAARVRTLALVEVIFAQVISQRVFKERPSAPETLGMAMIVGAAALLVSGATG